MLFRRAARHLWNAPAAAQQRGYAKAVAVQEVEAETITFPRESPGVSYALNWALSAKAVPPQGDVYRNLKDSELEEHGASPPESVSGSKIYARGSFSTGAADITKAQFNKIFKEVTQHLSSCPKLFVHDGAIGSSPKSDVKVRSISDNPSAAWVLRNSLCPTPTREVSHEEFPLSVYIASGHRPQALESLGLPSDSTTSYIAADYDRSALIAGGKAFADHAAVKNVLAAFAAPPILARGALPLTARLISVGDSNVIVAAPDTVTALREASVFSDVGVIWNPDGVARFFSNKKAALPNLLKAPASFVVVTIDRTGAIPSISKINPGQAAFHYLAGYDGETFTPGYNKGLASVNPVSVAKELSSILTNSSVPAFLVNAADGQKLLSDKELMKLVEGSATEKLPKSKGKKPSDDAVKALKAKYLEFMSKAFPDLPENITVD